MGILWIKLKQFSSSVMPAICQVLSSHIWLMATKLESTDYGTFPSWQSVLLDRSDLESLLFSLPGHPCQRLPQVLPLTPCCSLPPPAPESAEAPAPVCLALTPRPQKDLGEGDTPEPWLNN